MWRQLTPYNDAIAAMWWYQPVAENCGYVVVEMTDGQLKLLRFKMQEFLLDNQKLSRLATERALND